MNDLQRTEDWLLARKGKITASCFGLLMGNHKEPMTEAEIAEAKALNPKTRVTTKDVPFSQQGYTYLDAKVMERLMSDTDYMHYHEMTSRPTQAMQWGTEHEIDAAARYEFDMGVMVEDMPFVPLAGHEEYAGGSPDGKVGDGIVEFKCPYNPSVHLRHMLYETPADLLADNIDYYVQCVWNMVVSGAKWCDFVSWSCYFPAELQLKVLRLPFDEAMADELLRRESLAEEYINGMEQKILSSKKCTK